MRLELSQFDTSVAAGDEQFGVDSGEYQPFVACG